MCNIEVFTGPERHRLWSSQQKLEILAEAAAPGVTIAEVARRNDVLPQQIYTWHYKARTEGKFSEPGCPSPFIELSVDDSPITRPAEVPASDLMIGLAKGRSLRVSLSIDPERLRRLIRSIE